MAAAVTVLDWFLSSAYDLPKETARKVFKALRNFVTDQRNAGLNLERLQGKANDLWSIRVDDDYRIIFRESEPGPPVVLFVGKHDVAYRFADRTAHSQARSIGLFARERPSGIEEVQEVTPLMNMRRVLNGETAAARVDLEDLETMVSTRKYLPIARILLQEDGTSARFTFAQLEEAIADQFPPVGSEASPMVGERAGRASCPGIGLAGSWLEGCFRGPNRGNRHL
jgi:Txe/YoeB family toxin of Txe-Axe toxin-antitoxin module